MRKPAQFSLLRGGVNALARLSGGCQDCSKKPPSVQRPMGAVVVYSCLEPDYEPRWIDTEREPDHGPSALDAASLWIRGGGAGEERNRRAGRCVDDLLPSGLHGEIGVRGNRLGRLELEPLG